MIDFNAAYDMRWQASCLPEYIDGRRQAPPLRDPRFDLLDCLRKAVLHHLAYRDHSSKQTVSSSESLDFGLGESAG